MSIFRDAITGDDGHVDAGYLGLFFCMVITLGAVPVTLILMTIRMLLLAERPFDSVGVAAIIGAAAGGFATAAGGVGLFRMGDKPHVGTTLLTESSSSTVSQTTPPKGKK